MKEKRLFQLRLTLTLDYTDWIREDGERMTRAEAIDHAKTYPDAALEAATVVEAEAWL